VRKVNAQETDKFPYKISFDNNPMSHWDSLWIVKDSLKINFDSGFGHDNIQVIINPQKSITKDFIMDEIAGRLGSVTIAKSDLRDSIEVIYNARHKLKFKVSREYSFIHISHSNQLGEHYEIIYTNRHYEYK
jgi:hypothetical protein